MNKSLKEVNFPRVWKTANMIIILKGKGSDPRMANSYRPISLLPVMAKILEGLIVNRIEKEQNLNATEAFTLEHRISNECHV